MSDFSHLCGWHDNARLRAETRASMGMLPFRAAATPLMGDPPPADIMLYKAWKDVLGSYPSYPAQEIGDCESFGNGHSIDLSQCIEASLSGSDLDYRETSTEALYGAGREVGNMLGGGDGCYGAAMVKAMVELGVTTREVVGAYSGARAKAYGRSGMPADVRAEAAKNKMGASALVTLGDEAIASLANGHPVPISSNCGFQPWGGFHRNAQGICEAGGSWPHCMCLVGRISSDGVDTFVIAQSWGDDMPDGPQPFDLPKFCFRARREVVERYILASQDSYSLSKAPAFARRVLPSTWTNAGWSA